MEEVDSLTFTQWLAFNSIEPPAIERADWNAARLLAMTRNVNRGADDPACSAGDFLIEFWRRERLTPQEVKQANRTLLEMSRGIPGVTVTVLKPEEV